MEPESETKYVSYFSYLLIKKDNPISITITTYPLSV